MKIKYDEIKSRFDYNPRDLYYDGFEDDVVSVLIKKGYDAESDMGISQMKIVSTAPQSVLDKVIHDIEGFLVMSIWRRVAYWRKKYNSTPNGWAVASLIGSEYESEQSKQSKSYRKEKSK